MTRLFPGIAASCAVLAVPSAAVFQPIEGQPYRYVTRQTRTDGATKRSFTAERRVTFSRLGAGWHVDLVLDRTSQTAGGDVGAMFQSALAGLVGRPIGFDLDSAGHILRIDGLAALWAATIESIGSMTPAHKGAAQTTDARRADVRALTDRLAALPEERRTGIFASMLDLLIDPYAATRLLEVRRITLPGHLPIGTTIALEGTETVSRTATGLVAIVTHATGTGASVIEPGVPGAASATGNERVDVATLRRIDPGTGLVVYRHDEMATCTGPETAPSCISVITEITLEHTVL